MFVSPALYPAYALEHCGFGKPIENPCVKEVLPRIISLVAPILYAYQVAVYSSVLAIDLTLCMIGKTPGIVCQYGFVHGVLSFKNMLSSSLEIPEKLLFGAHHKPNYFGDQQRYVRKDLTEMISLL